MAFTKEQVTQLEGAISAGVLSVRYADRTVTYQSLAEMRKLLKQMRCELDAATGQPRRRRIVRLYQSGMGNG
ncbi:phage head-tail joining protein [Stenotrophomonas bentonitica]|uniref:phage head-tail joining protein n=1 Tax=Stenotrophomonas bentonitica TaxID=1450134 RepID=UPI00345E6E62